jgi:hypothetical protein
MDLQEIANHIAAGTPKNNMAICLNCHQPKSEHSIHDTFCLQVNGWAKEDFIAKPQQETLEMTSRAVELPIAV